MKIAEKGAWAALIGGAGIGLCPLLVATSLASIGLGVLAPLWLWLSVGFLVIGLAGFWLDYRQHKNLIPLILFIGGSILLFTGRYTPYGGLGYAAWEIWGSGGVLVLIAFIRNLTLRPKSCSLPLNPRNPA